MFEGNESVVRTNCSSDSSPASALTRQQDALFKAACGDPRVVAAALRRALGPEASAAVDWDTLQLEPPGPDDGMLSESHSSLSFSARAGDGTALVCLVFDHQSEADPATGLRPIRCTAFTGETLKFATLDADIPRLTPEMRGADEMGRVDELRAQDRARQPAKSVLLVLEARGLMLSDELRARVTGCSDIEQLDRWLVSAATASSTAAVFAS